MILHCWSDKQQSAWRFSLVWDDLETQTHRTVNNLWDGLAKSWYPCGSCRIVNNRVHDVLEPTKEEDELGSIEKGRSQSFSKWKTGWKLKFCLLINSIVLEEKKKSIFLGMLFSLFSIYYEIKAKARGEADILCHKSLGMERFTCKGKMLFFDRSKPNICRDGPTP